MRVVPETNFQRASSLLSVSSQSPLLLVPDAAPMSKDKAETAGHMPCAHDANRDGLSDNQNSFAPDLWSQDRIVIMSELVFKVDMFCKTMLYEMLPMPVAVAICTLCDGWQQARNRFAALFWAIVLPFFDLALLNYFSCGLYFLIRENNALPPSAGYEVLTFVGFPFIARAATLGVKYALYSDRLLSVDDDLSFNKVGYEKSGMQVSNQMGGYIGNAQGRQKEALLRFLYASMLFTDTDLSRYSLTYAVQTPRPPSPTHDGVSDEFSSLLECDGFGISGTDAMNHKHRHTVAAKSDHQAELSAFWVSTLKYLIGIADFDRMFASMDLDGSGTLDLGELRAALQRSHPSVTEEQVQRRMNALDADGDGVISKEEFASSSQRYKDLEAHPECKELERLNSHVLLDTQSGLLQRMMRNCRGDKDVSEQVRAGKVPCSIAAMNIVIGCSDTSKETGDGGLWFSRSTLLIFVCGLCFAFLGPVIRAAEGRPPFGTSAEEKIFYACKTLPELFYGVLLVFFPVFGCFWMFRQLLMARSLLDLIALPRRVDFRLFTSSKSTSALQTQVVALPRLDLSNPHNVQGWACLRRVIYGRNFAPAVELKMQFYVTITLFLFLISSAANTFGSFATPGVEIPLDFVIVSVMRPTLLSIPIVIQILLAYQINNIPFRYAEELNAQSATCLALAAEEARVDTSQARVEREDRVRDLQDAAGLLSAVAAEIESEAESRPMRVMFIKAEPAAASMIISMIMTIIAMQIYGVKSLV